MLVTVRDSRGGMSSTERASNPDHPLLADRTLFDEILNVVYAEIHKVLKWRAEIEPHEAASGERTASRAKELRAAGC